MSENKLRRRHFHRLEGSISVNKEIVNVDKTNDVRSIMPITSLSINMKNILTEDIDFIISELTKHKELLADEWDRTENYMRTGEY